MKTENGYRSFQISFQYSFVVQKKLCLLLNKVIKSLRCMGLLKNSDVFILRSAKANGNICSFSVMSRLMVSIIELSCHTNN